MNEAHWVLAIAFAIGLIGHFALFEIFLIITKRTKGPLDEAFVQHLYRPVQWVAIVLVVRVIIQAIAPGEGLAGEKHLLSLLLIGTVSWLIIKLASVLEAILLSRFNVAVRDNLKARKIHTQFRVLKKIITVAVCILAFATMVMTFDKARQLGTTILASAGIIGIVVGMAAQKTIGTFIAGLQIAFSQPIRIDDVIIVENEWGRIEEITLTYVVVKIWDQRRLIIPITYFIEKPFQNWTRISADILGTVFIYVDYSVPVDAVRQKLQELLNESELWDKKVCVLQVTNTTEKTVELRALMSAADASTAWTLRCYIREKLVEFLRDKYPDALPKIRAELEQKHG
ncbi:MAG: mechanosensitive ion channel [Sedimentisphaerales bacterium]|nr:mechanosensitive ion channel [Sedimentisphaerales bacterium]